MADDPERSLAPLIGGWVHRHCVVPDGRFRGAPFRMYPWQALCTHNHYLIKPGAEAGQLATAFVNRRSLVIGPQKALALDTLIATTAGWATMATLSLGDEVFDRWGKPTTIIAKSQVWTSDTYRITFTDGASLVACGDHEWVVDRRTSLSTYVPQRLSTTEMLGNLIDANGARRFRVPNTKPLVLPEADLPIPPYTLGAWLGDGEASGGRITGLDEGVFGRIEVDGFEVRRTKIAKRRQVIDLIGRLRGAGVLHNKHIPPAYLRGSEPQRWALLQGLMDTDGHAPIKGSCEFTTVTPALRDGFIELARSLGLRPNCGEGLAKISGRVTGPKWRITFAARRDMPVFGLRRKQDRLKSGSSHSQFRHRRIVAIDRVESVPTQCITVDSDSHTFLAGREMIPTGNSGKGPWSATIVAAEATGPVLFAGWAGTDDGYACAEHGCGCGWEFQYEPGDPMGEPWVTPLIQLTATAEDQVANVYRPLQAMIRMGRFGDLAVVHEQFIRTGQDGRIDVVTSSAQARLGAPVTFVLQDETGIWTRTNKMIMVAETQRRGAAGMGGRTIETTNPPDPSVESVALRTIRSAAKTGDIAVYHREPPASLGEYKVKANRRKIHAFAYQDCAHVDLDGIEAEAAELILEDPRQAERFFGNRKVAGSAKWTTPEAWDALAAPDKVAKGEVITLGFDGSDGTNQGHHRLADSTVLRACRVSDGYRWTVQAWEHPFNAAGDPVREWYVPRAEVMAKIHETFKRHKVALAGFDPPFWRAQIAELTELYGDDVIVEFRTANDQLMSSALERLKLSKSPHDGCPIVRNHVTNAVTHIKEYRDDNDERKRLVLVSKSSKDSPDKIDGLISDAIANDMRDRAIANGVRRKRGRSVGF